MKGLGPAAVLLGAAALYGMQRSTPLYSDITGPVPIHGERGKRVDAAEFAIAIANVHLVREVTATSFARTKTYSTSGVWVLVEGAAEARRDSLSLASAEWLGRDGVRYALSQRLSSVPGMPGSETLEPGIPRPMLMAFEVPRDQIEGGTLVVSRSAYTPLLEEVRIAVGDIDATAIAPGAALSRGDRQLPWVLEVR